MREMFSITGRDLCDSIPESEDFGSTPSATSRRDKVAQFELDDDYDIDNQL